MYNLLWTGMTIGFILGGIVVWVIASVKYDLRS
jgi:hypothetical protein